MSAKPSSLPRWADVGGAIVVPNSGKLDVGWVAAERPPAQYQNWLLNLGYQWDAYLSDGIFDGKFGVKGTLSPAAFSGAQNDYNPTNLATAAYLRLSPSAAATITGIAGGEAGRFLWLVNLTTNLVTLPHQDTGSTAGNRIIVSGSALSVVLGENQSALLRYDETSSRWRVVAHNGAEERWLQVHVFTGYPTTGAFNANGYWLAAGATEEVHVPIPVRQGDRIKSVMFKHYSGGAGNKTLDVRRIISSGTTMAALPGSLGTPWQLVQDPSESVVVLSPLTDDPYVVGPDEQLFLRYVSSASGDRFYGGSVKVERR